MEEMLPGKEHTVTFDSIDAKGTLGDGGLNGIDGSYQGIEGYPSPYGMVGPGHMGIGGPELGGYPGMGGYPLASHPGLGGYPIGGPLGVHPHLHHHGHGGPGKVTCCKTFLSPGPHGGVGGGPHQGGGVPYAAAAEMEGTAVGAKGEALGEAGTTCFHEPLYPNPFYLKQLKLQKLLYPFTFKKRLFFG